MANEFFIISVKEKCTYFDVTCRDTKPGVVEKMPGHKYVKIKLLSVGAYDIDILNAAMADGKNIKITIIE